jgi:uncharacterized protein
MGILHILVASGALALISIGMRVKIWAAAWLMIVIGWSASASAAPGWPASLTIGTASPGGIYLFYGNTLAPLLTEAVGIPVSTRATQGPDENILLLESGKVQLAFVTTGSALQAWNGTASWTHGKKLRSMRALFPMYNTPFQFVALDSSGISILRDMGNKQVGVGPQGGTGGLYANKIFEVLGIPAAVQYGAWSTMSRQMRSGVLDAIVGTAGAPFPVITGLDGTEKIRFIPLNDNEIAKLQKAVPEFSPSVVPAGAYPSLNSDYKTIGLFNFTVARKDLPADLAYSVVKAFYANHDQLVEATSAARESVAANVDRDTFIPYHPGALRYYREIGVELPAAVAAPQ